MPPLTPKIPLSYPKTSTPLKVRTPHARRNVGNVGNVESLASSSQRLPQRLSRLSSHTPSHALTPDASQDDTLQLATKPALSVLSRSAQRTHRSRSSGLSRVMRQIPVAKLHGSLLREQRGMVGLFGGTFSPAHQGHAQLAESARKRLRLKRIWWLPSPRHVLKSHSTIAPWSQRLASIQALGLSPTHHLVITPTRFNGSLYSAWSFLRHLKTGTRDVRMVWIAGSDSFLSLPYWRFGHAMMREIPMCVAWRPGWKYLGVWRRWPLRYRVRWISYPRVDASSSAQRLDRSSSTVHGVQGFADTASPSPYHATRL